MIGHAMLKAFEMSLFDFCSEYLNVEQCKVCSTNEDKCNLA